METVSQTALQLRGTFSLAQLPQDGYHLGVTVSCWTWLGVAVWRGSAWHVTLTLFNLTHNLSAIKNGVFYKLSKSLVPTADKVTLSCLYVLLMQPLSPRSPAPHPPSSSSFPSGVRRDPSIGRLGVLSTAFCSIWRHFEGMNKAAKLGREYNQ